MSNPCIKIDCQATSQDMDHLWGRVNDSRTSSKAITVDKATLTRLLLDHGKLLNYYERGL
jgi:hypothetical protein